MKRKWEEVFREARSDPNRVREWLFQNSKQLFILRRDGVREEELLNTNPPSIEFTPPLIEDSQEQDDETASLIFDSDEEMSQNSSDDDTDYDTELNYEEQPPIRDNNNSNLPPHSSTIDLSSIQHLSNEYPRKEWNDMYSASDFQKALLEHIEQERVQYKQQMGLVVLSTGLGKTIFAILLLNSQIDRHKSEETLLIFPQKSRKQQQAGKPKKPLLIINNAKRRREEELRKKPLFRFLFLVHSKLIRDGAYLKFREHFLALGFPSRAFLNIDNQSDVLSMSDLEGKQFIFCLFQSFDKIPQQFVREKLTHVCIDEVHHLVAVTYRQVFSILVSSLQADVDNPNDKGIRFILGMTATLQHREDPQGEQLKQMFRDTVYIDLPWTLARKFGYFPPVSYVECVTNNLQHEFETYESLRNQLSERKMGVLQFVTRLERSCKSLGMYSDEQLSKRTSAEYVCNIYHSFSRALSEAGLPQKRKTIIFAASCSVADELEKLLRKRGYSASSIHYNTNKKKLQEALEKFHTGMLQIVINVMMMNEGFDVKGVDCVVMARPTESELVFVQQMGRGLRKNYKDPHQSVTILDTCFNLRKRWKRLLQETDNDHLRDLILSFWHVDSFVGVPSVSADV